MVAPSSPFDPAAFEAGVEKLRTRYQVKFDEEIRDRRGYLAGEDTRRLAELRGAMEDPDVTAIVAARGGYGATRLLETLTVAEVATRPKLLVGFSDVTALHAAWGRAGLRSLHGPMVAALGRDREDGLDRFVAAAEGDPPPPLRATAALVGGTAEGPLLGGNLAVLASLLGTPWEPRVHGAVLLLEDVGERPYRIDRMLTSLRLAGWFERVVAVVLGGFTDCEPGPDGTTVEQVLAERLGDLPVPVLTGLPSGHAGHNVPLPLGAPAKVDGGTGTLTILEAATEAG